MTWAVFRGSFDPPTLAHLDYLNKIRTEASAEIRIYVEEEGVLPVECRRALCRLAFPQIAVIQLDKEELPEASSYYETEEHAAQSRRIRETLPCGGGNDLLEDAVYAEIVSCGYYGVKPELNWLRAQSYAMLKPKRIAHVQGCEQEAVRLAIQWGADTEEAAIAGILHDCTKKCNLAEQLRMCREYGIINDTLEAASEKLLHAKTGAAIAEHRFGVSSEVRNAIRWHTTGKPDMSLLEKIIYLADYIEPTRDFEGVDMLRSLAYENLDEAMALGLEMSLADIRSYGEEPYFESVRAWEYYREHEHPANEKKGGA